MGSVPIFSTVSCKDQIYATKKVLAQIERDSKNSTKKMRLSTYIASGSGRKQTTVSVADITLKRRNMDEFRSVCTINILSMRYRSSNEVPSLKFYSMGSLGNSNSGNGYQRDESCSDSSVTQAAKIKRQLRTLDSYFSKIQFDMDKKLRSRASESDSETLFDRSKSKTDFSSKSIGNTTQSIDTSDDDKVKTGLDSLENYFGRLSDVKKRSISNCPTDSPKRNSVRTPITVSRERNAKEETILEDKMNMDNGTDLLLFGEGNIPSLSTDDEASDLYLISLLAGINIAVFLFEIASPVSSELEHLSLPLIYGAKINKLILLGEWWRLLTPMFLHSGFPHVALSCWVLLTYGPRVCKAYGPFTFFLIYLLGGICGNLASFLHTPELTVCGTGPVFAILGAWLVDQVQNKEVASKEISESLFWKAVVATILGFTLSCFGRVDNWCAFSAWCI
ncbi:RHOMBOID-like protein 9, chloroplastic [Canna indica]|uniref:RHOMBOID-like protein 9, chloroplastic n=1 Tax=Canna indica TaxID=4628 RepID=A0AAQ3Q9M4_9LILI|nr:RHOMBOID-like protein 9, chloroplastic [Canna indica]